jgi:hypothetical protein
LNCDDVAKMTLFQMDIMAKIDGFIQGEIAKLNANFSMGTWDAVLFWQIKNPKLSFSCHGSTNYQGCVGRHCIRFFFAWLLQKEVALGLYGPFSFHPSARVPH